MGRSKFPGKPSKHVNKKRVNVLLCTNKNNDKINDELGNCCESDEPTLTDEQNVEDGKQESSNKKITRLLPNQNQSNGNYVRAFLYKYSNFYGKSDSVTKLKDKSIKHTKCLIKKQQQSHELGDSCRKTFYTRKRLKCDKQNERETSFVGKFVLPSRSLHSSRVIIPNKRFINHESSGSGADGTATNNRSNTRKLKLDAKRSKKLKNNHQPSENAILDNSSSNDIDSSTKQQTLLSASASASSTSSSTSSASRPCSKLVLRKARLQLHTKTSEGMNGPFSSYNNNNNNNSSNNSTQSAVNPPGTVTCGVCGAVRFYRFVKQARKFNIYSCESCRKFISKMIKRQTCVKNCTIPPLMCHKGQGMCHVPPIVRSQQWKLIRCAYKARCPACWLKMCLRSFQMPSQLKMNLINMLPENMRSYIDYTTNTTISNEMQQRKLPFVTPQQSTRRTDGSISNNNNTTMEADKIVNNNNNIKEKRHIKSRLRVWKKVDVINNQQTSMNLMRRQKLDLKGPRVKHVCRSASIVLGQPLATFANETSNDLTELKSDNDDDGDVADIISHDDVSVDTKDDHVSCPKKEINDQSSDTNVTSSCYTKSICSSLPQRKSNRNTRIQIEPCVQNKVITSQEPTVKIPVNYDIDGKEQNNGFELITSKNLPMKAVCLNCGSAGQNQLIYCACCCEPYHYYCLNNNFLHTNFSYNSNWKLTWVCSRCAVCDQCGNGDDRKFTCQFCHQYYHVDCSNPNLRHPDGPMVCHSCLSCGTCGSKSNITNYVCNMLVCEPCFKIRKRKNVCPICQKCDGDSKFNTKMIECRQCNNLVHTDCEEITDEMHQMFNYLPMSFTFTCRLCTNISTTHWKDTVNETLRNGYHIVLRSLNKHYLTNKLLKWNLTKNRTCTCKFDTVPKSIKTFLNNIENIRTLKLKNLESSGEETSDSFFECLSSQSDDNNESSIASRTLQRKMNKEYSTRINSLVDDETVSDDETEINCFKHEFNPIVCLLYIKRTIDMNVYKSIQDFHQIVEYILRKLFSTELLNILHNIIKDTFPWYNTERNNAYMRLNIENIYTHNISGNDTLNKKISEIPSTVCETIYDDDTIVNDTRQCALCSGNGDGSTCMEGRLLLCGYDEWVHVNCAFWSRNVYEEIDSSLQNVHETLTKSLNQFCDKCKQKGATVECFARSCDKIYHYTCARLIRCCFFVDKTTYCPQHGDTKLRKLTVKAKTIFLMQRPIYIEPNFQHVMEVELTNVQYLTGSLNVTNLGTFSPLLSDTDDAIVPLDFVCSRLFWSTVEPWKLVKYVITTSVFVPILKPADNTEKNYTVDHSFCRDEIDEKIIEIYEWKKDLDCKKLENRYDDANSEDVLDSDTDVGKVASQVLEHILELICTKEVEDNCDDEPQNTTDLLPPELKDAIFEDLPHDLLDGISMQDIFPKLMSYEDVITMDLRNSDTNDTSSNLTNKESKSDLDLYMDVNNCEFSQMKGRKNDMFTNDNDLWLEPKYSTHSLDDCVQTNKRLNVSEPELKSNKVNRNRTLPRSCSVTLRCKLDNTLTSNMKKRKISCASKNVADISSNLFMVVDGNDKNGMLQELRLPDGVLMAVGRSTNGDFSEFKYRLEDNADKIKIQTQEIEHGKENKCKIWPNRSQTRIVQVDGADDLSSSSDNDGDDDDNFNIRINTVNSLPTCNNDKPVKCDRCQCTYRTHSSYKKHLATCDFMTSESDSENEKNIDSNFIPSMDQIDNANKIENNDNYISIENNNVVSIINSECNIPTTSSNNESEWINYGQQISTITVSESVQIENTQVLNVVPEKITTTVETSNPPQLTTPVIQNTQIKTNSAILIPTMKPLPEAKKQIPRKPKTIRSRPDTSRNRNKIETVPLKRTRVDKPVYILTQTQPTTNYVNQTTNVLPLQPEIQNNSNGPMLIIQHVPSPNLMPVYVDAFQQQTGHNLQCIATITQNDFKPAPYVAASPITAAPFQIQSTEPTGVVDLQNGGLTIYSGLQPQSTVMGTLIQSRPATTIQCGMIATEQMMLGSVPTVNTIMTDVSGSMYLTPQPVYYGFETVVQNTVMSQQYVSTVPGVLASNSSYSATTTQVFQTSKIEPVPDVNGGSYILMNPSVPQFPTPTNYAVTPIQNSIPSIITQPQPLIQESPASFPSTQIISVTNPPLPTIEPVVYSTTPVTLEQTVPCEITNSMPSTICPTFEDKIEKVITSSSPKILPVTNTSMTSSINLPVAPYATENSIPLRVVNPIPQTVPVNSTTLTTTTTQISRPMNRVLPMQAAPPQRNFKKTRSPNIQISSNNNNSNINIINNSNNIIISNNSNISNHINNNSNVNNNNNNSNSTNNKLLALEPPIILNKLSETMGKIQETLNNDVEVLQSAKLNTNENQLLKLESASLKLVFQKQSQDGIYKISNKYISKNNAPVTLATNKQNKPKMVETFINVKNSGKEEKIKHNNRKSSENTQSILYKIQSQDGFNYSSTSITELWKKVFEAVQAARTAHNMPLLPENALTTINNLQLLGLHSNGLRYLVEQLPGANKCVKYKPLFPKEAKNIQSEDDTKDDSKTFRAARCELYQYLKQPYDMFRWLASRHRNPSYAPQKMDSESALRRAASVNLPMAMRFRQLKETSKEAVGVYRSNIHGRGLFCLRDIEYGEMVIEYAGEVIRSTLTDKREKNYNSKEIGCYMFRVDDNLVIDATMKGNAARFINHSCDPNCYSRVLDILGHKHILIFALRKIIKGEELTYDYKFPFEDDKIPCTCGSRRCRKYLN